MTIFFPGKAVKNLFSYCPLPTGSGRQRGQAAAPPGGRAGPEGGDGFPGAATRGPEGPGDGRAADRQLGQAEQTVPGPAEVRPGPGDLDAAAILGKKPLARLSFMLVC